VVHPPATDPGAQLVPIREHPPDGRHRQSNLEAKRTDNEPGSPARSERAILEVRGDHWLSSVSSICLAMGAATAPPVTSVPSWLPLSTITETANRGLSAGAKATNQACGASPSMPVCAVPVLPATATLGICAPVAVPRCTFSTIIAVTASAVGFVMQVVQGVGSTVWITLPFEFSICSPTCGSMITPPFATPAATSAISNGVTATSP